MSELEQAPVRTGSCKLGQAGACFHGQEQAGWIVVCILWFY